MIGAGPTATRGWWLAAACFVLAACSSKETLVVYSPHGDPILPEYEARFEAAYPDVDVQMLDMGSQDVYTRVRAESGRPAADVWWGGPDSLFMQAASEGLLEPYRPTWADHIDAGYRDANDLWYGTHQSPIAILYNTRGLDAADAPQTWDALLDPKWDQRIAIRYMPDSGTMQTFIGAIILRASSEDEGIDWLKRLHALTESYPRKPQLLFDHLKRHNTMISVWLLPDIVMQRDRHGYPFGYVVPPETPVIIEGIALIKDGPNVDRAKQFYEFVTTQEALAHQAKEYAKVPVRTDLDRSALPAWLQDLEVDAMEIDRGDFASNVGAWTDRWYREVYQGS